MKKKKSIFPIVSLDEIKYLFFEMFASVLVATENCQ